MGLAECWNRLRKSSEKAPVYGDEIFTAGGNAFAFALYAQLRLAAGNHFISPLSIRTALAMAMVGARGETAEQMRQVLQLPGTDDAVHALISRNIRRLNACSKGGNELTVANTLWYRKAYALAKPFIKALNNHYAGQFHATDFSQPEAAAARMNAWVEQQTNKRIQNLVQPDALNQDTRLVIINTVYFLGAWETPFEAHHTHIGSFQLNAQSHVNISFLQRYGKFRYMQGDGFQAVDLPYQGGQLSMLILLPDAMDGLPELESSLSEAMLRDCSDKLKTFTRDVSLPKFKLVWGAHSLVEPLKAMGMPLVFEPERADFSGISGTPPRRADALCISEVRHKTFLEVDERGTEAAAATEIGMMLAGGMNFPKVFRADHPFIGIIREKSTGLILIRFQ
jgi:serpin B